MPILLMTFFKKSVHHNISIFLKYHIPFHSMEVHTLLFCVFCFGFCWLFFFPFPSRTSESLAQSVRPIRLAALSLTKFCITKTLRIITASPSFFQNKWPVFPSNGLVLSSLLALTCEFKSASIKIKGAGSSCDQKQTFIIFCFRENTDFREKKKKKQLRKPATVKAIKLDSPFWAKYVCLQRV